MMIFRLKENFSKNDLQKSYKKLVKKYHPDSNPENQDWSHQKMTEINLAYELCCKHLEGNLESNQPRNENSHEKHKEDHKTEEHSTFSHKKRQPKDKTKDLSTNFSKKLASSSTKFSDAVELFFEYGLENRKLRHEGVRRFRYRECLRLFETILPDIFRLEEACAHDYDRHIARLFTRFTGNFYQYLGIRKIPRHPLINSHWDSMEEYLILALKIYLAPHLMTDYSRRNWGTCYTHCWNQQNYLMRRFPEIAEDESFLICRNLADSCRSIRLEENETGFRFFG
jgi:curved DNA-binding protein CbpA